MMPAAVAAGMSTLSTPMPARPITRSRPFAAAITFGVTLVAERMASPSYSPTIFASRSLSEPSSGWKSTSMPRSRKIADRSVRQAVGNEDARGHDESPFAQHTWRGVEAKRSRFRPPCAGPPSWLRRPSRAREAAPPDPASQPLRRTRSRMPGGASRCGAMSKATPSASSRSESDLAKRACAPRSSAVTVGSTMTRQTDVFERVAGSRARKSTQGVRATQSERSGRIRVGARDQRIEAADRIRPGERIEIVLDAKHRGRVDRLARENAFGRACRRSSCGKSFGIGQAGLWLSSRSPARGERMSMPCCASPPRTFCQEKVTTSSLSKGSGCAKAALVASQIVSPARSAAIHSPSGTRTPEVVPFQVKTTSRSKSTFRRSGSSP